MKISEVIRKLQEIQNEHGDIEVLALEKTCGECEWASLEDSGVCFDRYSQPPTI